MSYIYDALQDAEKKRVIRPQLEEKEEKKGQGKILTLPKMTGSVFDQ